MEYNKRTGYVFIKTNSKNTRKVYDNLKTYDWMIGAWLITGEYDIMAWVNAKNEDELYNYVGKMRGIEGIKYTNSHWVHNGYMENFESMNNPNGAWVRVRGEDINTVPAAFKQYKFIGNWANIPGEYDFLVWVYGNNHQETMENILKMSETHNWKTFTYVPVYTYINKNYTKGF